VINSACGATFVDLREKVTGDWKKLCVVELLDM
jgi:hypothetical protein